MPLLPGGCAGTAEGLVLQQQGVPVVLWKDNAFFKSIGKQLSSGMVEKLLSDGRIRLKGCKSKKFGKDYNATLVLSSAANGKANFNLEFETGCTNDKGGRAR